MTAFQKVFPSIASSFELALLAKYAARLDILTRRALGTVFQWDVLDAELVRFFVKMLIWALLTEIEKPENFKVLFGKKDKGEVSYYQSSISLIDNYNIGIEYVGRTEEHCVQTDCVYPLPRAVPT